MPRRDLTRVVVLCAFALAAACSRRYLVADAGVMISGDARVVSDAVADGRASDSGITDAPQAIDAPPAIDVRPPIDVPPAGDGASRVCPQLVPSTGQSCSDRPSGMLCFYDAPPSGCSLRCECRGQSWVCDRPCTTGACPGSPPISLATCSTPNLRCSYATGCAPRELMCMTFEVGAQGSWVCVAGCGPCDAGVDGPVDGGVDAVADAARDAIAEGGVDSGGDGGSGIPCGPGLTCSGTDICVGLNLCGGPVDCRYEPDGGVCPAGSTLSPNCPTGKPGCIPDCPGTSYQLRAAARRLRRRTQLRLRVPRHLPVHLVHQRAGPQRVLRQLVSAPRGCYQVNAKRSMTYSNRQGAFGRAVALREDASRDARPDPQPAPDQRGRHEQRRERTAGDLLAEVEESPGAHARVDAQPGRELEAHEQLRVHDLQHLDGAAVEVRARRQDLAQQRREPDTAAAAEQHGGCAESPGVRHADPRRAGVDRQLVRGRRRGPRRPRRRQRAD